MVSKNAKKDVKKARVRFRDDVLERRRDTTRRRRFARFSAQQLTYPDIRTTSRIRKGARGVRVRKESHADDLPNVSFRIRNEARRRASWISRHPSEGPIHGRSLISCRFAKAQKHRRAPPSVWASRRCVTTRRSARARSRGRSSARAGSRQVSCGRPRRAARRVCLPRRLHRHIRRVLPIRPSRRGRARRERGRFRASRRGDGRASRPPRRFQTRAPPRRPPRPAAGCVRCASPSSERRARRAVWTIAGERRTSCRVWRMRRAPSRLSPSTKRPRRSNRA